MEPTLKVLSPENFSWRAPTALARSQATSGTARRRVVSALPGVLGHVEPDNENAR